MESFKQWSSVTGFFQVARFQGSSYVLADFHSVLLLNNIPFYLSILQSFCLVWAFWYWYQYSCFVMLISVFYWTKWLAHLPPVHPLIIAVIMFCVILLNWQIQFSSVQFSSVDTYWVLKPARWFARKGCHPGVYNLFTSNYKSKSCPWVTLIPLAFW